MEPRIAGRRQRRLAAIACGALLVAALAAVLSSRPSRRGGPATRDVPAVSGEDASSRSERRSPALSEPRPPSFGWEEAAETVVLDLRGLLAGRARAGAFAEAQAEAAREDLVRYPPERERVRRMLMGSDEERGWALAASSALPDPDDELVRVALRSQRPEDDDVLRLLCAELAASLPPELLARHAEELRAAFELESNPLVLAVAMPALERLDDGQLRSVLSSQLQLASPQNLPFVVGLARGRLGEDGLADVGILVDERAH